MNGEMYQICSLAVAAKKSLKNNSLFSYIPIKYENKIEFQFLPEKKFFFKKTAVIVDAKTWFEYCLKKGLKDIKFLTNISVKDISLLGFSNTTQSSLVCFYRNKVTYFNPVWEYDNVIKKWNILYTEQDWKNTPLGKPEFENNTESFKDILIKISDFAYKIECNLFGDIFKRAFDTLLGASNYIDIEYGLPLPEMQKRISNYLKLLVLLTFLVLWVLGMTALVVSHKKKD